LALIVVLAVDRALPEEKAKARRPAEKVLGMCFPGDTARDVEEAAGLRISKS
jgi:hypothetical protein